MMLGNILFLLVIGVVLYMMMKNGGGCCGGHDHGSQGGHSGGGSSGCKHESGKDDAPRHMEAEKDPVCGMDVQDHAIEGSHRGRIFHFCSEKCRKVFDLNPGKYVST